MSSKRDDTPPTDALSERKILGAALRYPERFSEIRSLRITPEHFAADDFHAKIFGTMVEQALRGDVNVAILRTQLKPRESAHDANIDYFDELGEFGSWSDVGPAAASLTECLKKRVRLQQLEAWASQYRNDEPSADTDRDLFATANDWLRERVDDKPRFRTYTAAQLDGAEFPVRFLIDNILVEGQPCGVGGFEKSLKTTIMLASGIALDLCEPFLGMFPVSERKRFIMFSGESGMATLQETSRRICRSYGCELSELDGFIISPDLPQILDANDLADFDAVIDEHDADVVAIDPMYLCLGDIDERAANMFAMGKPLTRLNEVCVRRGRTLMFAHHFSGVPQYGATPKASQFAYSGFKQFLRQWVLLNRMEEYTPGTGLHRLKMAIGGNVGHGGLWIAEIDEGHRNDQGGRRWSVSVKTIDEAKQESSTRSAELKTEAAERKLSEARAAACRFLAKHPDGQSPTTIRDAAGISGRYWPVVLAALIEHGNITSCEFVGGHPPKKRPGYKLASSEV